jgi:hypothetical protein
MLILIVEKPAAEFYIADPESDDDRIPPTSTQSKKRQEPTRTFTKYVDFFILFSYLKSTNRNPIHKFSWRLYF